MTTPTQKSCATCPSFLTKEEAVGAFGKSIRVPQCARYGFVLDRPGFKSKETSGLQSFIGARCKAHGSPRPSVPDRTDPRVTLPIQIESFPVPSGHARMASAIKPATCMSCRFHVDVKTTQENLGWPGILCQAKGMLVMPHTTADTARDCSVGEGGAAIGFVSQVLEHYDPGYYHVDLFRAYGAEVEHPLAYVSDLPVSDEHKSEGIIGWRKVVDPQSSERYTYLPIFDPESFEPGERELIPQPGDDEHPELYLDYNNVIYKMAVCWRELDETPALIGPAGTGKTEAGRHMAYLMQAPFRRISITASTEVDDLVGKTLFENGATYFSEGRLVTAWRRPGVLVIDEPNVGQNDVMQLLRPLTDNSKQLVLDQDNGNRVTRHDHTYLLMAMNPSWDASNVGTQQMGVADSDRLMHVGVRLPPAPLEKKIVQARVRLDGWEMTDHQLDLLMRVAGVLRGMIDDGTLPTTWGIRTQIKVARAIRWFTPLAAYKLATDNLEPEAQELILENVKATWSPGVSDDEDEVF